MNIIYIFHSFTTMGGLERIFIDKANYLSEQGHRVTLVTFDQGNAPSAYPIAAKVKHIDLGILFYEQFRYGILKRTIVRLKKEKIFFRKLQELTTQLKPDIMICASSDPTTSQMVTQLKDSSKKVIETHAAKYFVEKQDEMGKSLFRDISLKIRNKLLCKCIRKADAFVALTQIDADNWSSVRHTEVIPNLLTKYPTETDCIPKLGKRVITAGRLSKQKGYDILITAWEAVHQKHPDWILDIYGAGEDENSLRNQLLNSGLGSSVIIHTPTPEIYDKYMESDFYVLSSRWEGFGLVLTEAMSCGIPCVSFDCPYGPSDIIADNEDGLLVENGNAGQLAEKICFLIENENIRLEMGKKARENVKRYLPENIIKQWEELFNSLNKNK